ncbi:MAG: OmpA family protein [Chitinivibrionales bacterium]
MLKGRFGNSAGLIITLLCTMSWASFNTNGHTGVVRTLSGKTQGRLKLNLGIGANYSQDSEFLQGPSQQDYGRVVDQKSDSDSPLIDPSMQNSAKMLSSNVFMNLGLTTFWDLGLSLPVYLDVAGFNDYWEWGLGDLEISTKILYPPPVHKRLFYQSYYLGLTVPTGSGFADKGIFARDLSYYPYRSEDDPKSFYTTNGLNFKPMLVWTFDIGNVSSFPLQIHLNVGASFSLDFDRDTYNGDNTVIGQLALEYTPAEIISLFVDVSGQSRWYNLERSLDFSQDLLMVSPGLQIKAPSGVKLLLSGDFCLSSLVKDDARRDWEDVDGRYNYSTSAHPRFGFQFAIAWEGFLTPQDDDHDGIKNDVDRCPKDPEDLDGFEDSDGCPDYDNDKDNIPDSTDKCPGEPEDMDGFEDEDGCPDPDNDGDGIPDLEDQCPRLAEDFDGIEDKDGCPDGDNDKDGIPDSVDRCPNDPEDFDNFEDDDGCPDIDNDKDGIPDLKDKCPNEPETFNNIDDEDGCPDKKVEKKKEINMPKQQIMHGVNFRSGRAEMTNDSWVYVDRLMDTLKEFPQVTIEIRGHTDSIGRYETNMRLSQKRAESVRQYMISRGIAPDRIRAVGYGSSVPVADNRTASGRSKNRRIEIIRTN